MDRTETTLRKLFTALPAPGYDLGVLSERGMYRLEAFSHARILRMLPYLKYCNANGAHIYVRPTGESAYTLLDDLTPATLARLAAEGYCPAAVVETSPGSFQAWLRHAQPLSKELGTLAAKMLAEQFGADPSAADWRRFGRAPGFTNRKPQHRNAQGLYPFARIISHPGQPFPAATSFRLQLDAIQKKAEGGTHRRPTQLCFPASAHTRFGDTLTLPHVAPLRWPASRRGYGFQHCRLCSGLGRVRDSRRTRQGLSVPKHQQHTPSRLHTTNPQQSSKVGSITNSKPRAFARQGEPQAVSPCTLIRLAGPRSPAARQKTFPFWTFPFFEDTTVSTKTVTGFPRPHRSTECSISALAC